MKKTRVELFCNLTKFRPGCSCLTCRRRKTRCFGERPVCSTCTKNNHTCQGYSDEVEKKTYDEELDATEEGALRSTQSFDNDSDEEDERRHSKSRLRAAQFISSPVGGKQVNFSNNDSLRKPTPYESVQREIRAGTPRQRDVEFAEGPAPAQPRRGSAIGARPGRHLGLRRVPYFRYFGPTAIVPGFKQVVVSVSNRRRSNTAGSFSDASPASALGPLRHDFDGRADTDLLLADDLPIYDPNDPGPVPPLIMELLHTFFLHLGCNYPFLRQGRFLNLVVEKRVEPILVDAICALAARFSESPHFVRFDSAVPASDYGQFYAQRAKAATVDTFACPSVGAVQACLLMAYEGFGANQDSALWMYLGIAIRMAIDLGLQKVVGIRYQGEKDPWYTRQWRGFSTDDIDSANDGFGLETPGDLRSRLSASEQKEVEQERIDTLWAVYTLDRITSSGTGRPVTFRDDDFELALPEPTVDQTTGGPDPYPHFIRIIHLYGRVSDTLNNIRNAGDLTEETWNNLAVMETELTKQHQTLDRRLEFNAGNFRAYVGAGKATTFILLHLWFHALIIVLHQPTLLTPLGGLSRSHQLLLNSRELSMSSAKTIADILAFAELIDSKSFVGNPFTSQPIYIAACAFLMESVVNASKAVSPSPSPRPSLSRTQSDTRPSDSRSSNKHSLLTSAANQNYQRCRNALVQLHKYWGGVKYILTALDQKSEGIWDVETYTHEEYESTKLPRRESMSRIPAFEHPRSSVPPIAWSLTGTTDSPSSNLTLMYQNMDERRQHGQSMQVNPSIATDLADTSQNTIFGPVHNRPFQQPTTSAIRQSQMPMGQRHQRPTLAKAGTPTRAVRNLEHMPPGNTITPPPSVDRTPKMHVNQMQQPYTPSSHPTAYEAVTPGTIDHPQHPSDRRGIREQFAGGYREMYGQDVLTFDSQEIDIGSLGVQGEMMPGWMAYLPAMNMYDGMGN